jgi:hypothetical protein
MRSNKQITTLAPTWLVMGVLIAGMMRTPAVAQTSQVDNPDWPLRRVPNPFRVFCGKGGI